MNSLKEDYTKQCFSKHFFGIRKVNQCIKTVHKAETISTNVTDIF